MKFLGKIIQHQDFELDDRDIQIAFTNYLKLCGFEVRPKDKLSIFLKSNFDLSGSTPIYGAKIQILCEEKT